MDRSLPASVDLTSLSGSSFDLSVVVSSICQLLCVVHSSESASDRPSQQANDHGQPGPWLPSVAGLPSC